MTQNLEFSELHLRVYRANLNVLFDYLKKYCSGDDVVEVKRQFKDWQNENIFSFQEYDDTYLDLIDRFLGICGNFESMNVVGVDKIKEGQNSMTQSIQLQRDVLGLVGKCLSIDSNTGRVQIKDERGYHSLLDTMSFLDRLSQYVIKNENETNLRPFLSGIRSMICAFLLLQYFFDDVTFVDEKFDRQEDLDMVATIGSMSFGFDITTKPAYLMSEEPVELLLRDESTRIKPDTMSSLRLLCGSKLVLRSITENDEYFDPNGWLLGVPSEKLVRLFGEHYARQIIKVS